MDGHLVRNLFDQYGQLENRMTHALAQVLVRDQTLLHKFVRFTVGISPPQQFLVLSCQVSPGEQRQSVDEEEAERRGIPDLWIWNGPDAWALVCECKVTATPTQGQLQRHVARARRLGFKAIQLLVITTDESRPSVVPTRMNGAAVAWINWAQLFAFFGRHRQENQLITEFLNYVRVVEGQLMAEGYAGPPLTTFTGIPFGPDHPYTTTEAIVLLRALMAGFRKRLSASSALPINIAIRRHVIAVHPWDAIGFRFADLERPLNEYPHLTVGIDDKKAHLALTLPDQDASGCWKQLRKASKEQLKDAMGKVARRLRATRRHVTRDIWEPQVYMHLFQRHFYAQRYSTMDGEIRFDLGALLEDHESSQNRVRMVPAWLDAIYTVLAQTTRANFELQLRAEFPLLDGSVTRKPGFVDTLVQTSKAFQPFLAFLLGDYLQSTRPVLKQEN